MRSRKTQTIVSLDKEQIEWLENKVNNEGYSKSGLIRSAIKRLMEEPNIQKDVSKTKDGSSNLTKSSTVEKDGSIKEVEIDRILEFLISEDRGR